MPSFPAVSSVVSAMRGGVFSTLAHKIAALQGEIYPFHVGDTWMQPPVGARMEDLREADHPGMHRYSQPHGYGPLIDVIAARRGVGRNRVLISAGATGGLGAAAGALLDPGDEVLLLSPYWPLIRGIVASARGVPVDVPWLSEPSDVAAALAPYVTARTVAIYVNTPNNPTGRVMGRAELAAIAAFAATHDLWIWSDEVYEDYAYAAPHVAMSSLAPERTFSAYSFSKAYGMAGNRVGYLIGPADPVMLELRKISTHSFYAAPTGPQIAGLKALEGGADWLAAASDKYRQIGADSAAALGLPAPEGGTFLFLDVAPLLDDRGLQGFLEDCLDDNLILAPGPSFGQHFTTWVRLCFTAAPPDVTARGVARLAARLGRV